MDRGRKNVRFLTAGWLSQRQLCFLFGIVTGFVIKLQLAVNGHGSYIRN